jgi:hypothetical protein
VQNAFDVLARTAQVSLDLLDRAWLGALIDALLGKALIAFAILVAFRFVKALETKWANQSRNERENFLSRAEAEKLNSRIVPTDNTRYMPRT